MILQTHEVHLITPLNAFDVFRAADEGDEGARLALKPVARSMDLMQHEHNGSADS
jgi:hypothetical protein